jgi:hypothetical protein
MLFVGVGVAQLVYWRTTGWATRIGSPALPAAPRPSLGPTHTPIQEVSGAISPEVKRQERVADHSPPSSAEVKKSGAIPPLPIYLHGIVLL